VKYAFRPLMVSGASLALLAGAAAAPALTAGQARTALPAGRSRAGGPAGAPGQREKCASSRGDWSSLLFLTYFETALFRCDGIKAVRGTAWRSMIGTSRRTGAAM
jgi:hypothetical protein